jgi:glucokinase-like ROK family protein
VDGGIIVPQIRTGDPALIREINLSIILSALRDHSLPSNHALAPSRATLAATTGLTKATVSNLVEQLSAAGFITERGIGRRGLGRPGMQLQLNPEAGAIIGVEIGVDFISVLLTDFAPQVLWRHHERTDQHESQNKTLNRVFKAVHAAREQAQRHGLSILGVALGIPGLVDTESGELLYAPNLHWENVPLRRMLTDRFEFPVYVDNEASIAAFGETYLGVARGTRNMVFVAAGVGIGGGLVINGHMFAGATGLAGEVGHMTIESEGLVCNCGNRGCWETVASQNSVFRRVQERVAHHMASSLAQYTNGQATSLTIPIIVQAADEGDLVAREALEETGVYLGIGMANLVNAFNPEMVVLGGILSVAKEYIMPVIERTINERALRWSAQATQTAVAANGSDACAMGGVAIIHDRVVRHPLQARRTAIA